MSDFGYEEGISNQNAMTSAALRSNAMSADIQKRTIDELKRTLNSNLSTLQQQENNDETVSGGKDLYALGTDIGQFYTMGSDISKAGGIGAYLRGAGAGDRLSTISGGINKGLTGVGSGLSTIRNNFAESSLGKSIRGNVGTVVKPREMGGGTRQVTTIEPGALRSQNANLPLTTPADNTPTNSLSRQVQNAAGDEARSDLPSARGALSRRNPRSPSIPSGRSPTPVASPEDASTTQVAQAAPPDNVFTEGDVMDSRGVRYDSEEIDLLGSSPSVDTALPSRSTIYKDTGETTGVVPRRAATGFRTIEAVRSPPPTTADPPTFNRSSVGSNPTTLNQGLNVEAPVSAPSGLNVEAPVAPKSSVAGSGAEPVENTPPVEEDLSDSDKLTKRLNDGLDAVNETTTKIGKLNNIAGTAMGITGGIEDIMKISDGDYKKMNGWNKASDIAGIVGGGIDAVSMALPFLAPLGSLASAIGAVTGTVGELKTVSDQKQADKDGEASDETDAKTQGASMTVAPILATQGLIASRSMDNTAMIAPSGSF